MATTVDKTDALASKTNSTKAILKMGLFPLSLVGVAYAASISILLFALGGLSALPGVLTFLVVFGLIALVHFFRIKRALEKTSKKF